MALKVDLPEELTPAYFKKHLEASAPTGALLNKHLVTVTKAHTSIDWKAFDVPGSGKASELEVLHKALKAEIDKSVAAATAAAKAASTEGDKVLAAMKKGKAPGKALEAAQKLVRNAQAYAASLVKQTDAAAAELAKKVTAAGGQAAKDEAKKDDAKAAAGGAYDKALKLMKSRTMPWLRTVRANNPELPTPCFMAALSPTGGALMLNKAVGGAEKKVLGTLLPGQKGVKFFRGTVVWEARALTFVSASPPSGAAKKLQLAMRQMLKLNLKVRVRKPSGEVEEEEGDDISQFTDDGVAVGSIDPAVALKALAQRYEAHKAEIEAVCKMTAGKESKLAQALRDKLRAAFQDKAVGIATATMDQLEALILSVRVVDEDASEFADADSSDEAAVDTPTEGAAPDAAVVDPAAPAAPAAPADAWAAARKLDAQLAMVMQALGKAVPGLPAGASKKMIPMALEIMAKQRVKAMAMAKPAHAQTELTKLLNACKTMAKASQIAVDLDLPADGARGSDNAADAGIKAAAQADVGAQGSTPTTDGVTDAGDKPPPSTADDTTGGVGGVTAAVPAPTGAHQPVGADWEPATVQAAGKSDDDLAAAKVDMEALPAGSYRDGLLKRQADLVRLRATAIKQKKDKAAQVITASAKGAAALLKEASEARPVAAKAAVQVRDWSRAKVVLLKQAVDGATDALKKSYLSRLAEMTKLADQADKELAAGKWKDAVATATKVFFGCEGAASAINTYATEHPLYLAAREQITREMDALSADKAKGPAVKNQLARLDKELKAADKQGFDSGYAVAKATLTRDVAVTLKIVKASADAFALYAPEAEKVKKALADLKKHARAADLPAEIKLHTAALAANEKLGKAERGGWQKAMAGLKILSGQIAATKKMADELQAVQAKLPDLTKKLTDGGVKPADAKRLAVVATKMLVNEKCTDEQAVDMAKDAEDYRKGGLDETDAMMSSRVKSSLKGKGIPEDRAKAIGKNIRATGSSSAEDAKAVADGMSRLSAKAVDTLNDNGIVTECCRGPVTESLPELVGEHPRGWPANATWDKVPGVYSGATKKVVVGTMDDGSGNRKVPGPSEGPIPHGTPDLIGHEAGHAFDTAEGSAKSGNAAFLKARAEDIAAGSPGGMFPPGDNYFLGSDEGGTNTAGAASETFAESFAMHFKGNVRWGKLKDFWAANPWGI